MPRTTNSTRLSFALILFTLAFAVSCDQERRTPTLLRAGYVKSASGVAIFRALETNCLPGFEIEAHSYSSSDLLAADLVRGEIQVALVCGITQVLQQYATHPDAVRILAAYESTPCLLVPLGTAQDLSDYLSAGGRTIGCWPGTVFPHYTRAVLESLGVDTSELYISPTSPGLQVSQLKKNEIDALFTLEPIGIKATRSDPPAAEYRLVDRNLLAEFVIGGDFFPGGCLAALQTTLDRFPGLRGALVECVKTSGAAASGTDPATVQALAKYTSLSPDHSAAMDFRPPITGTRLRSAEIARLIEILIDRKELPQGIQYDAAFLD